ncbi:DUF2267 domain-containing protein [Nocardiopsis coralli]|uniref:DUF2267 domain-containing protein n=1 Tax=Nocardiopsis coralli TaxID=2772213 RepID=UPI001C0F49B3|nr:DUF2267 domain-containing protein [Nocardiopsis coralli]
MQYHEFIAQVSQDPSITDNEHAEAAITATLQVLGRRLAGGEPSDLAAQLPVGFKDLLAEHTGAAEAFDVDEFLRRIAQREGRGCGPEQAREHARAVMGTIAGSISAGEVNNLRSQLPAGYAFLLD